MAMPAIGDDDLATMRRLLCLLVGHQPAKVMTIMGLEVRTCARCTRTI
jgi:hypothetical protein